MVRYKEFFNIEYQIDFFQCVLTGCDLKQIHQITPWHAIVSEVLQIVYCKRVPYLT